MIAVSLAAKRFLEVVKESAFLSEALQIASESGLEHWCIAGGAIRDTVWAKLLQYDSAPSKHVRDIDLLYYDRRNASKNIEREVEARLKPVGGVRWSVKNQARMHIRNQDAPYQSLYEAMYCAPETISAIGLTRTANERYVIFSCFGTEDLLSRTFRPTPHYLSKSNGDEFMVRLLKKGWLAKWPAARVVPW